MFKKLIHFASNIIKPGKISEDTHPLATEVKTPSVQTSPEYQPQLGKAISLESKVGSDHSPPHENLSYEMTSLRASEISCDRHDPHQNSEFQVPSEPTLETLYRAMTVSQGMLYIAQSFANCNEKTYLSVIEKWLHESDFQTLGAIAITAKRQGNYPKAMSVFNDLAQGCPYYYQIHHSTMKILGASGDLEAALQALKLWCVATIPDKVLRLTALNNQPTNISTSILIERLSCLAGWAIADTKSMYHLGSLQLIVSDELPADAKNAYILSLQGKKQQALHPPKIAIQRGKEVAQSLPWDALIPVMDTELWQGLVWRSQQQAQNLEQRRRAA